MLKRRKFVAFQSAHQDGQALVEYGLILALVALVAIVGLGVMGSDVGGLYDVVQSIADAMSDSLGG